jgi:hypothetical protein
MSGMDRKLTLWQAIVGAAFIVPIVAAITFYFGTPANVAVLVIIAVLAWLGRKHF